jgi:Tfp pilus assembly protein PilO
MSLAGITALVALIGGTYLLAEPRLKEWATLRSREDELRRQIGVQQHLIAQETKWTATLADLKRRLPTHPQGKDVTTDLQILIEKLASANRLTLSSRDAEKETLKGNMFEVAVNCKWEGKLESLVRFLFDLQREAVILDVSQLTISPSEKKTLRGGFTVYCSYSRASADGADKKPETKGRTP